MRSVNVVTAHDDNGELEALLVGLDKHLGRSLGGSVRVRGCENAGLEEVVIVIVHLAIDLIGGDVNEALDVDALGALKQNVGAVDVGVSESI